MFSLLTGNRPPSFEIPVTPPAVATSFDVIFSAAVAIVLAFTIANALLSIFGVRSRARTIFNCIIGIFAVVVIIWAVIFITNKPPAPPREPDVRYGSMSEAIEEDYEVFVTSNRTGYTVSTNQKQYDCEVVVLDDNRYTIYCDSRGERVALDKLLAEETK